MNEPTTNFYPPNRPSRLRAQHSTWKGTVSARLGTTTYRHTQMLSRAWTGLRDEDDRKTLAHRENVSQLMASTAIGMNRRLTILLGKRRGPLLDRSRLSMRAAHRLSRAVPLSAAMIVFQPWENRKVSEAQHIAWQVMRDNGSRSEARKLGGTNLRDGELRGYRLLAAVLRHLEHDPKHLPLDVALHTLRDEVISRKALPLIGSSWDAKNLIVPPMIIPPHRAVKRTSSLTDE